MNISDKLNTILDEYSKGNKKSAYKRFKKIYLQNSIKPVLLGKSRKTGFLFKFYYL